MEGFTAHQASKFTGCTPRQLRYWDEIGLVSPSVQGTGGRPGVPRLYSFRDLVALKVVKSLLDGGMSLQRVRRAWSFLNRRADLDQHLSEVKLVTDGQSIFKICRKQGEILDGLGGFSGRCGRAPSSAGVVAPSAGCRASPRGRRPRPPGPGSRSPAAWS